MFSLSPVPGIVAVVAAAFVVASGVKAGAKRDPLLQPFASTSIWNLPLHRDAVYLPAGIAVASHAGVDEDDIILRPDAPELAIYYSDAAWNSGPARCRPSGDVIARAPVPEDWTVAPGNWDGSTPNSGTAILMKDRRTVMQTQPFARCVAGAPATSLIPPVMVDIYGEGIEGAHGGSGLSSFGGALRVGELTRGRIDHVMKINLNARVALSSSQGGYRWPAIQADGDNAVPGTVNFYGGTNPALRMGALLAIRPEDFDALVASFETGQGAKAPAVVIATALRDYGAYVVDNTAWDSTDIVTEWGPDGRVTDEFRALTGMDMRGMRRDSAWARDVGRIVEKLYVIDNNGPKTPGGGPVTADGRGRRAVLAPDLGAPGCGDGC